MQFLAEPHKRAGINLNGKIEMRQLSLAGASLSDDPPHTAERNALIAFLAAAASIFGAGAAAAGRRRRLAQHLFRMSLATMRPPGPLP